jgi:uncharacterized protein (DUF362 family)/NAD-dependent dihydropyrimidine dehydrogenase PreA subunit
VSAIRTPSVKVAIVRTQQYEINELYTAISKCLSLIGGLEQTVRHGSKVFVKINHLPPPSPPERGIVTHPQFTEAVLEILKETGAVITVGDDVETGDEDGFSLSGYREMCHRLGVVLVNLREAGYVIQKCNGSILKEVYLSRLVLESDVIINLPKFKTHSLTLFTGGIKNLYGTIPAGLRRQYHGEFLNMTDFCRALVDVYSVVQPQLTIMDGIMAMEGEGPGSGKVRNLGLILASRDTVALDATAPRIIGLEPDEVLTTRFAAERGLGVADPARIEIMGEKIEAVSVSDFKMPTAISRTLIKRAPRFLGRFAVSQITPQPYVKKKNCTACGECVKACPTDAATLPDKTAKIEHSICIRCMCCHEVCRYDAIVPRRPFLGNIIYRIVSAVRKVVKI